ncbi:MAG: cupin domain-containing protein [Clostridia bacterium]|nr:cupin domain-containing protein [Clostridia bacterium]
MIKFQDELTKTYEYNKEGKKAFTLFDLSQFEGISPKLKMFSYVEIDCGEEVPYHEHHGDAENYYIISGEGLYDDNGSMRAVSAGTITFTPSGQGHALKNVGKDKLCFIALILKNE